MIQHLTCGCVDTHVPNCPAAPRPPQSQRVVDFGALARQANSGVGARFVAAFTNRDGCPECGGPIDEGDEVGWVDDVVVCGDCHDIARQ